MAILSVGELDFIEGQPFTYVSGSSRNEIYRRENNNGTLLYEKEVPGTWRTSAKKARWLLKSKYIVYDLNDVNLLNINPTFDKKKNESLFL